MSPISDTFPFGMTIRFFLLLFITMSTTQACAVNSLVFAFTEIFEPVTVTFSSPYTVFSTSPLRDSISVKVKVSLFSVWSVSTVSPPHALISSDSGEFLLVSPSSEIYPSATNASFSAVVVSVGRGAEKKTV